MPLPAADGPAPKFQPKRPTVPFEGKLVSIPAKAAKYSYPAYGEAVPAPTVPAQTVPARENRPLPVATLRISYPAYGDR
jgi:hypothetical protein